MQTHGLTPLEKRDFWDFEKIFVYNQKSLVFFLSQTPLNLISSPFLTKKK